MDADREPDNSDESASVTRTDGREAPAAPRSGTPGGSGLTIVGIGASAGGLAALKALFSAMPDRVGVAFVVVVHLSPERESHLAELLQPTCAMPVLQVTGDTEIEPDHVYVIPPGANLNSVDTHLRLTKLEERQRDRAPIDHFFRTLSGTHDGESIGVILTGSGSDGALGLRRIKERGGVTIVQTPDEAECDGMPRAAVASGVVDLMLPLSEIPSQIVRIINTKAKVPVAAPEPAPEESASLALEKILAQVRGRSGADFTAYKRSTLLRRIQRRMQIRGVETLTDYLEYIRDDRRETMALFEDLLITVTEFFRDREAYAILEKEVLPKLLAGKDADDAVRVWSVGCSTGEEAYSLGMLLLEHCWANDVHPRIQIFASDLHEGSLAIARDGVYPDSIVRELGAERVNRFFTRQDGALKVRKELRELVVFAPHNLLKDPPFSSIDLISCRNLLIYLKREAQEQAAALFHYALKPDGLLFLGSSESIDESELFTPENKQHRLFRRRNVDPREPRLQAFQFRGYSTIQPAGDQREEREHIRHGYGDLHAQVVELYGPPSVLISQRHEIVHYSSSAGRYLEMPGGEPTNSIFKLVREPLRIELRAVVHAATAGKKIARSQPIDLVLDGEPTRVLLRVRPAGEHLEGFMLVMFDELDMADGAQREDRNEAVTATAQELETELSLYKERLQHVIEEYETGQEEMRASNEELQSTNEELRSTLEELETSKEELQSMNEELATVNQENRHRVEELSQLSADLQNLLAATDIATIFLDRSLRIVRFTPQVSELFSVRPVDRGRPLNELTHRLGDARLESDARRVLDKLAPIEREVQAENDRWYLCRVLPYRATDDRIDGVVITLIDITERKKHEERMQLVMAELNHRVKNMLAIVDAIAAQTFSHTPEPEGFREAFGNRLRALSKAHSLLTTAGWAGVPLRDLVEAELVVRSPEPQQAEISGPEITLRPQATTAVHMMIHELATNAMKHGALSTPEGRIRVRWAIEPRDSSDATAGDASEAQIVFRWDESTSFPLSPPTREGFGTKLLAQSATYELSGEAKLDFRESGLLCVIHIPLKHAIGFAERTSAKLEAPSDGGNPTRDER